MHKKILKIKKTKSKKPKKKKRKKERKKKICMRSSPRGSVVTNLTSIHEDSGSIPGVAPWVKDPALL